jgi:hypothetical protein
MQHWLTVDFDQPPGSAMGCSQSLAAPDVHSAAAALLDGASLRSVAALEVYNLKHVAQGALLALLARRLRPTLTNMRLEFKDTSWRPYAPPPTAPSLQASADLLISECLH